VIHIFIYTLYICIIWIPEYSIVHMYVCLYVSYCNNKITLYRSYTVLLIFYSYM